MSTLPIFKEIVSGKTLTRILLNQAIEKMHFSVNGTVIDLASGINPPSYFRFITQRANIKIISVNINPKAKPTILADFSNKIPLPASSADLILFINAIYLMANPGKVLQECHRILKPGARILINFPLIWPIVNEPKDYWRFTDNTARMLLKGANLQIEKVMFYGERISSAVSLVDNYLPIFVRIFLYPFALTGDKIFNYLTSDSSYCPIGILVTAKKS